MKTWVLAGALVMLVFPAQAQFFNDGFDDQILAVHGQSTVQVSGDVFVAGFTGMSGYNGTKGWYLCNGDRSDGTFYGPSDGATIPVDIPANYDFRPFVCEISGGAIDVSGGASVVGFMPSMRLRDCDANRDGDVSRAEAKACWECEPGNFGQDCSEMTQAYPLTPVMCRNFDEFVHQRTATSPSVSYYDNNRNAAMCVYR